MRRKSGFLVRVILVSSLAVLTWGCFAGKGTASYNITGRILDENGNPAARTTIAYEGKRSSGSVETLSDGSFTILGIEGNVDVIPTHDTWTFLPPSVRIAKTTKGLLFLVDYEGKPTKPNWSEDPLLRNLEQDIRAPTDYSALAADITVHGRVTCEKEAKRDAAVYLVNLEKPNVISFFARTDYLGNYSIPNVTAGLYKIVFMREGCRPVTITEHIIGTTILDQDLKKDGQPIWLVKETDRMIYHFKEGQEVSKAEINWQEERLRLIEDFFGVTVPQKIEYYQGSSPREVSLLAFGNPDHRADGFFIGSEMAIYSSSSAFNWHETTHAVAHIFNPNGNSALNEGLAVFFGWGEIGSPLQWRFPLDEQARDLMHRGELYSPKILLAEFEGRYTHCGAFVNFLLQNYSIEQYRALYANLPAGPTEWLIDQVLMAIYGRTSYQLYNEWRVYLGGSPVAKEDLPIYEPRPVSEVFGTIHIEGYDSVDLQGKEYFVRDIGYRDEELTDYAFAGIIELDHLPFSYRSYIFLEGEYYILYFLDLNQNLRFDEGEPYAVGRVKLDRNIPFELDLYLK